jgi:hypothetical protein
MNEYHDMQMILKHTHTHCMHDTETGLGHYPIPPPPLSLHLLDEVFGVRRHVIWKRQIHLCICVGVLATFKLNI